MTPSKVLLVDDHPVVLEGVRSLLASTRELEIVGESTSGKEGLELARQERPDLILLDLRLADCMAADLCWKFRSVLPDAKIVILTAYDDPEPLVACLRAGASGVLLKDANLDLPGTLIEINGGQKIIDKRVLSHLGSFASASLEGEAASHRSLTPREREIVRLMARGMTDKEIAAKLYLAPNTVRSYSQSIRSKLDARNRIQAVARARERGLI